MKKSAKRLKVKTEYNLKEGNIRETVEYKLLIFFTILLIILVIVFVGIKVNKKAEEKRLAGELGTLGIFGEAHGDVGLEVTNFKISEDNLSINVSIQRDGAAGIIKEILIIFNRTYEENCNYSIIDPADMPLELETKEYIIDSSDTNCGENNFTNVFNVSLDWEVVIINLTQIRNIEEINMNGSRSSAFVLNLDNYFENVGSDSNFSIRFNVPFGAPIMAFSYSYLSHNISFDTSNTLGGSFVMNMNLSHPNWNNGESVASNSFNVSIYGCLNYSWGAQNFSVNKTNFCMSNSSAIRYYCSYQNIINNSNTCSGNYSCSDGACVINNSQPPSNHPPTFNDTECDNLEWDMNDNYVLNMKKCWYDLDGDNLTGFRYTNSSHSRNLTITQNSTNLTLTPDHDWYGTGYFTIYANDSKNETSRRIDFEVIDWRTSDDDGDDGNTGDDNSGNPSGGDTGGNIGSSSNDPRIVLSSPTDLEVHIFNNTNKTFTISASGYTTIKWYLNGAVIAAAENRLTYDFSGLKEGDSIKVEVINGTKMDSRTWTIKIETDEEGETPIFDMGEVLFYSIVAIVVIIIGLIVWLFIVERNKKRDVRAGKFGITRMRIDTPEDVERDAFNIPS